MERMSNMQNNKILCHSKGAPRKIKERMSNMPQYFDLHKRCCRSKKKKKIYKVN